MLLHAGIAQVLKAILRRAEHRIHPGRVGHVEIAVHLVDGNREIRLDLVRKLLALE